MRREIQKIALVLSIVSTYIIMTSCGGGKSLTSNAISQGNVLFAEGRHQEAMSQYLSAVSNNANWDSVTLRNATIAAFKTGHDSLAYSWCSRFRSGSDTAKIESMLGVMTNLGKDTEKATLVESNKSICERILGKNEVNSILARFYAMSCDEKIVDLYPTLENDLRAEVLACYLSKAKLSSHEATKLCKEILKTDNKNIAALNCVAKNLYDDAESRYTKALEEYNKNKTQVAYVYMSRELKKVITPIYKESCDYFEKLQKLEPQNKNHVRYLININTRLQNKEKVKELEKLLK